MQSTLTVNEPFAEDMELDLKIINNWLMHFNLLPVKKCMSGLELLEMIRKVQPEILNPVHTENKELIKVLEEDSVKAIYPTQSTKWLVKLIKKAYFKIF